LPTSAGGQGQQKANREQAAYGTSPTSSVRLESRTCHVMHRPGEQPSALHTRREGGVFHASQLLLLDQEPVAQWPSRSEGSVEIANPVWEAKANLYSLGVEARTEGERGAARKRPGREKGKKRRKGCKTPC